MKGPKRKTTAQRAVVAFGPEMPEWGSWVWLGQDMFQALSAEFTTSTYPWNAVPECDVLMIVKHLPPEDFLVRLGPHTKIIYCPVDYFACPAHIEACAAVLRRCARIVIHCARLRPYFECYAPVDYLDHPLKFVTPKMVDFRTEGYVLWVGVWTNLEPLVAWFNAHPLPGQLKVLTNLPQRDRPWQPEELGFDPQRAVSIEPWSEARHLELLSAAKAAIDVKGDDFRAQNKPPAKGLDFLASGIPLAMNGDSSTAEHLARLGFSVACPSDLERWFSRGYWQQTRRFGRQLRKTLSLNHVAQRYAELIRAALQEDVLPTCPSTQEKAPPPMSKKRRSKSTRQDACPTQTAPTLAYQDALRLALDGRYADAAQAYQALPAAGDARQRALVCNDRAVLGAMLGDQAAAAAGFDEALAVDPSCAVAVQNRRTLATRLADRRPTATPADREPADRPCKVVVVSFLFNWPSTGGGIVHTFELVQFLARAGYDVHHVYVRFPAWGIGEVSGPLPFPSTALEFDPTDWNRAAVQARVRAAVDAIEPDHVIITDSWNFKPLLAEAVRGYPYILRLQASECLCPLNNVRLLLHSDGRAEQCGRHQLARPDSCRQCLATHGHCSGALHRAERELSGVGTPEYDAVLHQAFADAEATFVVNPMTAAMVSPYTDRVVVSPAGMDPARFPWPWTEEPHDLRTPGRTMIFFAGLVQEAIKGYHVLHEACRRLWQRRQDFELVATGDPPGQVDAFTRFVGWLPQADLPRHLRAADICAVPAIAQEALGRTAVEAMGVGRPVVATRLGGLPFTVTDGATGLLCEPDSPDDLAAKLAILLDDAELRQRLGQAGRRRFDEQFRWDVTIERDYRPLLLPRRRTAVTSGSTPS